MNNRRLNVVRGWRGVFALAGVCVLPVAQVASAQGNDDQYDVTVKMEMAGMPMAMPPISQRLCVRKGAKTRLSPAAGERPCKRYDAHWFAVDVQDCMRRQQPDDRHRRFCVRRQRVQRADPHEGEDGRPGRRHDTGDRRAAASALARRAHYAPCVSFVAFRVRTQSGAEGRALERAAPVAVQRCRLRSLANGLRPPRRNRESNDRVVPSEPHVPRRLRRMEWQSAGGGADGCNRVNRVDAKVCKWPIPDSASWFRAPSDTLARDGFSENANWHRRSCLSPLHAPWGRHLALSLLAGVVSRPISRIFARETRASRGSYTIRKRASVPPTVSSAQKPRTTAGSSERRMGICGGHS